jgi:hypothetical protein
MKQGTCEVCGRPMPPGEEMFRYHGYSGPCPIDSAALCPTCGVEDPADTYMGLDLDAAGRHVDSYCPDPFHAGTTDDPATKEPA